MMFHVVGQECGHKVLFVLSQITRLTDGRTDSILIDIGLPCAALHAVAR